VASMPFTTHRLGDHNGVSAVQFFDVLLTDGIKYLIIVASLPTSLLHIVKKALFITPQPHILRQLHAPNPAFKSSKMLFCRVERVHQRQD